MKPSKKASILSKVPHEPLLAMYFDEVEAKGIFADQDELRAVAIKSKAGDALATKMLIEKNLRFAFITAYGFRLQMGTDSFLSFSDLIQECNVGLVMAAKKYDATKEWRFSSYCIFWMRKYLLESVNKYSRVIRIPENLYNRQRKLSQLTAMMQRHNMALQLEDVMSYLGIGENSAKVLLNSSRISHTSNYVDDSTGVADMAGESREDGRSMAEDWLIHYGQLVGAKDVAAIRGLFKSGIQEKSVVHIRAIAPSLKLVIGNEGLAELKEIVLEAITSTDMVAELAKSRQKIS
jgi:DNA-directed RNA polymerase specialized sigma subunit